MKRLAILLAAASVAVPAVAQVAPPRELSLEHRMLLRCAAAFALVAYRQETGEASAAQYPPLGERGREYFVRASAKVMDEAGLDRNAIGEAVTREAAALMRDETLADVMPACLSALEAGGP